jgi:peroxiredoxin family protein
MSNGQIPDGTRKIALIVSKGGMDEVFPALILANGARQSGIEACVFFTFYGLDAITESKIDHLHVNMAGNASSPMPTVVAGLPGMESVAATMMKKRMKELDIPTVREFMEMLDDSGVELYGCELAMNMFGLKDSDLIEQVKDVITVGDFYDISDGGHIVFT